MITLKSTKLIRILKRNCYNFEYIKASCYKRYDRIKDVLKKYHTDHILWHEVEYINCRKKILFRSDFRSRLLN